ncbi:MAG: radical SAM protein [Acidobacteria bacterium]|nr:radical SAM protein [Acidobacteriota bacterium]
MRVMEWEIKMSKLCNLRCTYCYEFEELDDRRRISLDGWRAILESARWYQHELERQNPDEEITTRFVWHGGEPSMLPLSYFEQVLALEREVLGAENINTVYHNHIPTNLYAVPPRLQEFWEREQFVIAVSYDVYDGARVNTAGQQTGAKVGENIRRRLAAGRRMGCNTVLNAYNVEHLLDIYEHLKDLNDNNPGSLYWTIIPLHKTSTDDGNAEFSLTTKPIVDVLGQLFERWLDDPQGLLIQPLQEHYLSLMRQLTRSEKYYFSRRAYGESSLMVNTDGHVYVFNGEYEMSESLGCIFDQPLSELRQGERYRASLERQDALEARFCHGCPHDGYCNRAPVVSAYRNGAQGRCAIAYPLQQRMLEILARRGMTAETLQAPVLPVIPQLKYLTAAA